MSGVRGFVIACVVLFCACSSTMRDGSVGSVVPRFSCGMELPAQVVRGESVSLTFHLRNDGATAFAILTWFTPFEGLMSPMFRITHGAAVVPYEGRMIKRGQPTADDYVIVPAGGTVSRMLDLRMGYALDALGFYDVAYVGQVRDVIAQGIPMPRSDGQQQMMPLVCAPLRFELVAPGDRR